MEHQGVNQKQGGTCRVLPTKEPATLTSHTCRALDSSTTNPRTHPCLLKNSVQQEAEEAKGGMMDEGVSQDVKEGQTGTTSSGWGVMEDLLG